jgi:transketolase
MTELGQKNEMVALCADLIGSLKFDDFKKNHPFSKSELLKQT